MAQPQPPRRRGALSTLIVAALAAGLWRLNNVDTPLPHPAQRFKVVNIDELHLPIKTPPFEGVYATNELLRQHAHKLFEGTIHASESIAVAPDGSLTMADKYGYVYSARVDPQAPGGHVLDARPVAYLGPGRPLGLMHNAEGNLIVADALKGLIMLEKATGQVVLLANAVSEDADGLPGSPIAFADDLDISPSTGSIYFSDAQAIPVALDAPTGTYYDVLRSSILGLYSGEPQGRLLRYDPATRRTAALVSGLWFANGVALAADESFVLVVETNRLRLMRHHLVGPKAGTTDVFIDKLPGFPDNVRRAEDGSFWVGLVAPVSPVLQLLRSKAARALLPLLPYWATPKPSKWGAVLHVSAEGAPLQLLLDEDGRHVSHISCVTPAPGGRLYLGNVHGDYISYVDVAGL